MPRFIGKGIKYADFKYPLDAQLATFIETGLASSEPVDVKGVKVSPIDLLVERLLE